ncbi:MAG: hypothetical protein K0Q73_8279 [Paenibacillus sp.]|nr:hypothetical protein [Paenibacillus sp.]
MKGKHVLAIALPLLVAGIVSAVFLFRSHSGMQLDPVKVNDIVKTISENWTRIQSKANLQEPQYKLDYAVLDKNGDFIAATRNGLNENTNDAIRNRDTIVEVVKDGEVVGKVIFYNNTVSIWTLNKMRVLTTYIGMLALLMILCAGYTVYLNHTIIRPFHKMKKFAGNIAAGNFDVPLEMDRSNLFGAFTESFDIMREELHIARENEWKANQSKKELVASLSHDIKKPLSSIRAVSELMLAMTDNEQDAKRLETIGMKAEQIETLLNNLFHATLEELQELSMTVNEVQSTVLPGLIQTADYKHRIQPYSIQNCIVLADVSRLQQVLDNIISNSYKYAGTPIEIATYFEEDYLVLEIKDFGSGVPDDELPFLMNKYYRGKNAPGKNGYGLGLNICKSLMEKMSGKIQCENRLEGFTVRLMLQLAE